VADEDGGLVYESVEGVANGFEGEEGLGMGFRCYTGEAGVMVSVK
jgi:hypothetical protein